MRGPARLGNLLEAAVRRGAGRQSVMAAVNPEVGLDVRILVGVSDAYRLATSRSPGRQTVRGLKLYRAITGRCAAGIGGSILISNHVRMAPGSAESGRAGTNSSRVGRHGRSRE